MQISASKLLSLIVITFINGLQFLTEKIPEIWESKKGKAMICQSPTEMNIILMAIPGGNRETNYILM